MRRLHTKGLVLAGLALAGIALVTGPSQAQVYVGGRHAGVYVGPGAWYGNYPLAGPYYYPRIYSYYYPRYGFYTGGYQPYSYGTYYSPAGSAYESPSGTPGTYSYGAYEPDNPNVVRMDVRVPADADVWVEGTRTAGTGELRHFVSPPLTPAVSYVYDIRARWTENGHVVDSTRPVRVRPGSRVTVDFLRPADARATETATEEALPPERRAPEIDVQEEPADRTNPPLPRVIPDRPRRGDWTSPPGTIPPQQSQTPERTPTGTGQRPPEPVH